MVAYSDISSQLEAKRILTQDQIYHYETQKNQDLKLLFETCFNESMHVLDYLKKDSNFKCPYFIFYNDYSINAFAKKTNEYELVAFFRGLIENIYYFFYERQHLFLKEDLRKYSDMALSFGKEAWSFQMIFFTKFILFHEYAHLLQNKAATFYYQEMEEAIDDNRKIIASHVREFDSDCIGLIYTWDLCLSMFKSLNVQDQTDDNFTSIQALGVSAIYSYFLMQSAKESSFYLKDKSHPHPHIRIGYISDFLIQLNGHHGYHNISQDKVFSEMMLIASRLTGVSRDQLLKISREYANQITGYIGELSQILNSTHSLAFHRFGINSELEKFGKKF